VNDIQIVQAIEPANATSVTTKAGVNASCGDHRLQRTAMDNPPRTDGYGRSRYLSK